LWELPVIFVCENNGMAEFTSREEHSTIERVSDVVAPYGFERTTVNGSDVPAVYDAFAGFVAAARAGKGPYLLECVTYRRRGHYEGDAEKYRDPVAEREWAERDPLARMAERAITEGWIDQSTIAAIEQGASAEVEDAVRLARESPLPDPAIASTLVYAK
jgi:pyruvate dehydrogenase E1 component alpha subunit